MRVILGIASVGQDAVAQLRARGSRAIDGMLPYLWNCFWLMVPVLVFNLIFSGELPQAFQRGVFWHDIPRSIAMPENVLRTAVMLLPLLMRVGSADADLRKTGLGFYLARLVLYFASWGALIVSPNSVWSKSAIGFMAPAWTPAFWLLGIALLSGNALVVPLRFYRRWMFALVALAFLVFHNLHTGLVYFRLHDGSD